MVNPGTYKATVVSHAISETKSGDPQAVVTFSFESEGKAHTIPWYGYFTEKTTAQTVKSLIICGLKGNNPAGPLEIGKEVNIVIEVEIDQQGKERNKVRWVNALGGIKNVIPQDMAKAKLAGLEGAVMAARQNMSAPMPTDDDTPEWMR